MSIEKSLSQAQEQEAANASPEPVDKVYNPTAAELLSETDKLFSILPVFLLTTIPDPPAHADAR